MDEIFIKKVRPLPDDGQILQAQIAGHRQAEEDLYQEREWLRVTLGSIGDAVITSDTEGRITFLNPVAATLTGWQLEEAIGPADPKRLPDHQREDPCAC